MMKLWIYENHHICELWSEELNEGCSSQFYTQLMSFKRKPDKKSGLYGIRTLDLCNTGAVLYKFTNLLTRRTLALGPVQTPDFSWAEPNSN